MYLEFCLFEEELILSPRNKILFLYEKAPFTRVSLPKEAKQQVRQFVPFVKLVNNHFLPMRQSLFYF